MRWPALALTALAALCAATSCKSRDAQGERRAKTSATNEVAAAAPSPGRVIAMTGKRAPSTEGLKPKVSADAGADDAAARIYPEDPIENELARASIVALAPRAISDGLFDVALKMPGEAAQRSARLSLAMTDAVYAHKRPLAFYRLARALDARIVPVSVHRRVSAGELGGRLADQPSLLAFFKARAAIANDGAIDALLSTWSASGERDPWRTPSAREIAVSGAPEIEEWATWASSREPVPFERARLLRDYVEMLVLDYLSANVLRRTAGLDERTGSLTLTDNATAFPLHVDPRALDQLLTPLQRCARFPRGLRERLARFDRRAAAAVLAPAGFETWLVSPRSLIALDERRAGLLTLIEAKLAEAGGVGTSKEGDGDANEKAGAKWKAPGVAAQGRENMGESEGETASERAVLSL